MNKLNNYDIKFILDNVKLSDELLGKLDEIHRDVSKLSILTDDDIDMLRDLCGEELQVDGFDDKYKPTKKGFLLEKLIDKLYLK